jgi:sn-glycerol 3-phosphate transport system ATP-binding protein
MRSIVDVARDDFRTIPPKSGYDLRIARGPSASDRRLTSMAPTKTTDTHGQSVELRGVSKAWDGLHAVRDIDIEVEPGTFTVLLGPSGCGKSTTLRIIAGLEFADRGQVLIGGRDVSRRPPSQRDIAMVFQSYALFPHLSVAENILFGLKVRRTPKKDQQARLSRTAATLGLTDYLARKPAQLSGGQQQRVALGRAIIAEKPICLMDEPLSNLDAKLRHAMRSEIRELQQTIGFSMAYVTHDQAEAITMADQVVLMRDGQVEQAGPPREIYERPATAFVAGFIGTPPMNLVPGIDLWRHLTGFEQAQTDGLLTGDAEGAFTVGVRPEHIRLTDGAGVRTQVHAVEYLGSDTLVECRAGDATLVARVANTASLSAGDSATLTWWADDMHFFAPDTGARLDPPPKRPCAVFAWTGSGARAGSGD